ncbi:MAG: hypothetical protein MJ239_07285 [Bacilli bacterium]|nr:hypothetical protein [Bacilli bacterium]
MKIEKRKIRYRLPTRVVAHSDNIENVEALLVDKNPQIGLYENDCLHIKGKGYIILDFGEELAGGISISTYIAWPETKLFPVRIRFGESLTECCAELGEKGACNDHAIRDMEVALPFLSTQSYGDTGFRFVRIDFLSELRYDIKAILTKEWYREFEQKASFKSEDPLLNKIFECSKRTVTLNVQNNIWDGIKRDRLVWIGDMEPEVHALLHLYGDIEEIEQSIAYAEATNPMPGWMNGIPSYSLWYLLICFDRYDNSKDGEFAKRHVDYMNKVIAQFDEAFGDNGEFSYERVKNAPSNFYFIDWPSNDIEENEKKNANVNLAIYVLKHLEKMYEELGYDASQIKGIIAKAFKVKQVTPTYKQFAALHYLVHKDDASYDVLVKDGTKGMSTFLSYYTLTAVADKDLPKAIEMLKEYYGAMLDKGATTFWEDFNIEWAKGSSRIDEFPKEGEKDIHGDFGAYCYVGFRHSLCHGWSSGPVSFLIEQLNK